MNAALGDKVNTDEDLDHHSWIRSNDPLVPADVLLHTEFGSENLVWTHYHFMEIGTDQCLLCGLYYDSWTTHCSGYYSWINDTTQTWVQGSRLDFKDGDWWFDKPWIEKCVADTIAANQKEAFTVVGAATYHESVNEDGTHIVWENLP